MSLLRMSKAFPFKRLDCLHSVCLNCSGILFYICCCPLVNFLFANFLKYRLHLCLRDKIDMAGRLFDALKVEDQSLRFTIQEATNSLAIAYKVFQFHNYCAIFMISLLPQSREILVRELVFITNLKH